MGKFILLGLLGCFLAGCATDSSKMNHLSIGMTKEETIKTMGDPDSIAAENGAEFLEYDFCGHSACVGLWSLQKTPYYVKIVNNRVESFGRRGDFGTAGPPAQKIIVEKRESASQ